MSTSLTAVHLACQALLSGETDLALAGGVTIKVPQRIGYLFRAAAPLKFNVHFHDGNAVIEPVSAASTKEESGEFSADRDQTYCLMWEAGAAGSVLDYRVGRLRR